MLQRTVITLFFILLFISSTSHAQLKPGESIWTTDVGFSLLNIPDSEVSLGGYVFTATYDQLSWDLKYSGGASFGYIRSTTTISDEEWTYSSIPLTLQGKLYLLSKEAALYLQGGIGVHFSQLARTTELLYLQFSDVGLVLNAGLGFLIPISKNMFISLSYQFNWYDTSYYKNGFVHLFRLGLAFN